MSTNKPLTPLQGYDNRSVLFDAGDSVIRKVSSGYFETIEDIFALYIQKQLVQLGVVETEIDPATLSLKHKKHVISYPYEWTANMYKDAVLFHLRLFMELDQHGLTLKDALPGNILFHHCAPVFVDFSSFVRKEKLEGEEWLVMGAQHPDPRFAVVKRMLMPYMLIPFAAMLKKDYPIARRMLSEQACNCTASAPAWRELKHHSLSSLVVGSPLKYILSLIAPLIPMTDEKIAEMRLLLNRRDLNFVDFIREMTQIIADADVTPSKSAYLSYYEKKRENLDFSDESLWNNKQKNVCGILKTCKPKTVLDIGANTGWFSTLAATLGAEVIATDIDESCIDSLYLLAKEKGLQILPLALSFDELTREIYGVERSDPCYAGRDFKETPLFLPATRRFKSELVLCLGLLHHLILGMGKEFGAVMEVLAELTDRCLVLEFVSIDDKLILGEPSFFRNIHRYSMDSYNIDKVLDAGRKYFNTITILDSHPETRKLLIFEK